MGELELEITVNREQLLKELEGGTFARITFVKKNGEIRKLVGRLGVRSKLRGGDKAYSDADKNIVTIFDTQKGEYRSVKVDKILEVAANGKRFKVTQ